MLNEWLGKVVDKEDLTRHDKWLCLITGAEEESQRVGSQGSGLN